MVVDEEKSHNHHIESCDDQTHTPSAVFAPHTLLHALGHNGR